MPTRRTSYVLLAVLVSAVTLAPERGAALPDDEGLDPLPVHEIGASPDETTRHRR